MIRRWSCINELNFSTFDFKRIRGKYKINIFRSSVSFRRPLFLFTKFKRKILSQWKRRSTWYPYFNLFKNWSSNFFFLKKTIKIQFLLNSHSFSFITYHFNIIKNIFSREMLCSFPSLVFFFPKKIYNYFDNKNSLLFFNNSNYKNNNFTLTLTNNNNFEEPTFFKTIALQNNKIIYSSDIFLLQFNINQIFNFFIEINLFKIKEIYKIYTILYASKIFNVKYLCF